MATELATNLSKPGEHQEDRPITDLIMYGKTRILKEVDDRCKLLHLDQLTYLEMTIKNRANVKENLYLFHNH